MIELKN